MSFIASKILTRARECCFLNIALGLADAVFGIRQIQVEMLEDLAGKREK